MSMSMSMLPIAWIRSVAARPEMMMPVAASRGVIVAGEAWSGVSVASAAWARADREATRSLMTVSSTSPVARPWWAWTAVAPSGQTISRTSPASQPDHPLRQGVDSAAASASSQSRKAMMRGSDADVFG